MQLVTYTAGFRERKSSVIYGDPCTCGRPSRGTISGQASEPALGPVSGLDDDRSSGTILVSAAPELVVSTLNNDWPCIRCAPRFSRLSRLSNSEVMLGRIEALFLCACSSCLTFRVSYQMIPRIRKDQKHFQRSKELAWSRESQRLWLQIHAPDRVTKHSILLRRSLRV